MAKHSLSIAGHQTSVTLEDEFWTALNEIARSDGRSIAALVAEIDASRPAGASLSSAIRVYLLRHYRGR